MTKTQELWADTIVYRQTGQDAVLRNNIQIADQEQKAMAFGDYGQYWGDKKQALLTRDPSVLSYEEGEQPDTVFMRSDSIFIYTLNRFRNDSVPTQKTADSLAAETPAPSPARRRQRGGPSRDERAGTSADSDASGRASSASCVCPRSAPGSGRKRHGNPGRLRATEHPGRNGRLPGAIGAPVPDSVSTSDSVERRKTAGRPQKARKRETPKGKRKKHAPQKSKRRSKPREKKQRRSPGPSRNRNGRGSAKSWPVGSSKAKPPRKIRWPC